MIKVEEKNGKIEVIVEGGVPEIMSEINRLMASIEKSFDDGNLDEDLRVLFFDYLKNISIAGKKGEINKINNVVEKICSGLLEDI